MESLEAEAKRHFTKLEQSIQYHEGRLQQDLPEGIKRVIRSEIEMLRFMSDYAREALHNRGLKVE